MARSVRISASSIVEAIASLKAGSLRLGDPKYMALAEFESALARLDRAPTKARPKRKPPLKYSPVLGAVLAQTTKTLKREHRAAIREACFDRVERDEGICECGCGQPVRDDSKDAGCYPEARGEMDHFWGKAKAPETVETCWILRPGCHLEKTRNQPNAAAWLRKFIAHCERYGFAQQRVKAESRLRFVEARSSLPASPRVRP